MSYNYQPGGMGRIGSGNTRNVILTPAPPNTHIPEQNWPGRPGGNAPDGTRIPKPGEDPLWDLFFTQSASKRANADSTSKLAHTQADTSYNIALGDLAQRGLVGARNIDNNALARGVFASGERGVHQGELNSTLGRARTNTDLSYTNRLGAIDTTRQNVFDTLDSQASYERAAAGERFAQKERDAQTLWDLQHPAGATPAGGGGSGGGGGGSSGGGVYTNPNAGGGVNGAPVGGGVVGGPSGRPSGSAPGGYGDLPNPGAPPATPTGSGAHATWPSQSQFPPGPPSGNTTSTGQAAYGPGILVGAQNRPANPAPRPMPGGTTTSTGSAAWPRPSRPTPTPDVRPRPTPPGPLAPRPRTRW